MSSLGECCGDFEYGMNAPAKKFDGINKYIRITDIDDETNRYDDNNPVSPDGNLDNKYIVKKNDILFARTGASTGKTYLYNPNDGKLYFAGFLIRANVKDCNDARFVFQLTQTSKFKKWINIVSMRSGQPGINSQEYASFSFEKPQIQEQKKIAEFLSLLDKRIETQRSAIEKLKSLKSAINDRLYDMYKGGITTSFSEFGDSYSGLSGKTSADFGRGKPFITYLNVFQNDIVNPKMIDHVSIDDDENQNIVKQGDLLFTLSSETPEEVGYGAVYMDDKEIYLNSFCFGVHITRKDLIYSPYMSCLFSTRYFRKFMYPLAQGSTRYNLQKTDFEKKKISIPSLDFQKKIYKIVSALSSKIEEESAFLSLYMNQKQYVLNKMFI